MSPVAIVLSTLLFVYLVIGAFILSMIQAAGGDPTLKDKITILLFWPFRIGIKRIVVPDDDDEPTTKE